MSRVAVWTVYKIKKQISEGFEAGLWQQQTSTPNREEDPPESRQDQPQVTSVHIPVVTTVEQPAKWGDVTQVEVVGEAVVLESDSEDSQNVVLPSQPQAAPVHLRTPLEMPPPSVPPQPSSSSRGVELSNKWRIVLNNIQKLPYRSSERLHLWHHMVQMLNLDDVEVSANSRRWMCSQGSKTTSWPHLRKTSHKPSGQKSWNTTQKCSLWQKRQ